MPVDAASLRSTTGQYHPSGPIILMASRVLSISEGEKRSSSSSAGFPHSRRVPASSTRSHSPADSVPRGPLPSAPRLMRCSQRFAAATLAAMRSSSSCRKKEGIEPQGYGSLRGLDEIDIFSSNEDTSLENLRRGRAGSPDVAV